MTGFTPPLKVTCADHEGDGAVAVPAVGRQEVERRLRLDRADDGRGAADDRGVGGAVRARRTASRRATARAEVQLRRTGRAAAPLWRAGVRGPRRRPGRCSSVNNIEVIYDHVILVLKGVSLEVPEGGIVALLGANGAGKTTTLKAISNLLRAERGEVTKGTIEFARRAHRPRSSPSELVKRGVVQVMEGRHCFEHLTVEENLLTGAYTRGDGERAIARGPREGLRLLPAAARSGARAQAGYTSGGEQQMTAIGRALMARPEDDPARRAVDGPGAAARRGDLRDRRQDLNAEERRHLPARRAEHQRRAALRRLRLHPGERPRGAGRRRRRRCASNEDVKEFYLGLSARAGARASATSRATGAASAGCRDAGDDRQPLPQASLTQRTGFALAEALRQAARRRAAGGRRPDPPDQRPPDRWRAPTSSCPIRSTGRGCARRTPRRRSPINSFLPWRDATDQLPLAGWIGFDAVQFEVRCPTGLRGTPPHLDLLALRGEAAVAVTVRCIEYLSRRKTASRASYDRLLADDPGLEPWRRQLERLRARAAALSPRRSGRADQIRPGARADLSRAPDHVALPVSGSRSTPISSRSSAATARSSPSWRRRCADARVTFAAQSFEAMWRDWASAGRAGLARRPRRPPARALLRHGRARKAPVMARGSAVRTRSAGRAEALGQGDHFDPAGAARRRTSAIGRCSPACPICCAAPSTTRRRSPSTSPESSRTTVTSFAALAALPLLRKSDLVERQQASPPFGGLTATPVGAAGQAVHVARSDLRARGHAPRLLALRPRDVRGRNSAPAMSCTTRSPTI